MRELFTLLLFVLMMFRGYTQQYPKQEQINYRTIETPFSSAFANVGELQIHVAREFNFGRINPNISNPSVGEKLDMLMLKPWGSEGNNRVALLYSPIDHWTFGITYVGMDRSDGVDYYINNVDSNLRSMGVYYRANSFGARADYHLQLTSQWAYELGVGFIFGKGRHRYLRTYVVEIPLSMDNLYFDDIVNYSMYNQNIRASMSFRWRALQLTAQLNAGYLRYFNIKSEVRSEYVWAFENMYLSDNLNDFYCDPSLIMDINFRRLSVQIHCTYQLSAAERKMIDVRPIIGFGLSYKILKTKVVNIGS